MEELNPGGREVYDRLLKGGAHVVGVANVERFEGAPKGHHPCDFLPKAGSVVTFGVALLLPTLYWEDLLTQSQIVPEEYRGDILQNYLYRETGYVIVNCLLDALALSLANWLQNQGFPSMFFPAT